MRLAVVRAFVDSERLAEAQQVFALMMKVLECLAQGARASPSGKNRGRLVFEAPEALLGDDAPVRAGFGGICREGFVGVEVQIALDGKS